MKTIEETLLNRTSVRRYEYDKIPSETLDFIYRAIANTPTSYNGQQFSVIAIDDQSIKKKSSTPLQTKNKLKLAPLYWYSAPTIIKLTSWHKKRESTILISRIRSTALW